MAMLPVECPVCGKYLGKFGDKSNTNYPCSGCHKRIVIQNGQAVGWK